MPRSNNCISGGRRKFSLFDRSDPSGNLTPLWHRGGAFVFLGGRHKVLMSDHFDRGGNLILLWHRGGAFVLLTDQVGCEGPVERVL